MLNLLELLKGLPALKRRRKRKSWFDRTVASQKVLAESRQHIHNIMKAKECISNKCSICDMKVAVIMCNICSHNSLCQDCDKIEHANSPFHDRIFYNDGCQYSLTPLEAVNDDNTIEAVGKSVLNQIFIKL